MAKVALHTEELAVDTTNNDLYRKNPDGTYTRISTSGASLVHNGLSGEGHTRHLTAVNATYARATNGADFTAVGGIKECYVTLLPDAAWTNEKKAIMTYGAVTEAQAGAYLADPTTGQTNEVQQIPLVLGVRNGPFTFVELINWIDIDPDVDCDAIVEGVTP